MSTGNASQKFGRSNAQAGLVGERYLSRAAENHPRVRSYTTYQSMRVPNGRGGRVNKDVDIDFVFASGNRAVLVDCKMWSSKHFYWSLFDTLMKGFHPSGKLSRNMEMARNRTQERLPGSQVLAIVCFVPTKGGRTPKGVGLLLWPGRIRSYMTNDALNKISRYLGEPTPPNAQIQALMGSLTR